MRKRRHLVVCDSCGCVPCECDRDNPHSPGQKRDRFDNPNYDPWSPVDADEPTVEELIRMATMAAA
jgi:hypothetical protein